MNDYNSFNAADFGKYLLETNTVAAGKEKFFVHWVRKFFEKRILWPNLSWNEQLPLFLLELQQSCNFQDWQIRQADQAVRMYFTVFNKGPDSIQLNASDPIGCGSDEEALKRFSEALKG
jgi:hypothetical protein